MFPGYENPTPGRPVPCGRYQLLERIGFGGMAEIFKARLPGPAGFGKTVVIKRILPRLLDEENVVQMFLEEAKIAAAADHDNIAKVFELGQTEAGEYFMVMEYIAGVDLELLLRAAAQRSLRVPPWFTVRVISDLLEALSFVHALEDDEGKPRNVIHRDVTPSNIFVSFLGKVKLADFGVADFAGKSPTTKAGQLKGKLAYMSPEQLNAKMLDQRSDLFSTGVVLWEALAQQRLFGQLNDVQAMLAICDAERRPPSAVQPDIPPALDAVVLKALDADRDRRHRSASDLQSELLDCLHAMRPPVRSSDVRRVVQILLGREEPDAETSLRPAPSGRAPASEASFLSTLDPSERKRLAEEHAGALRVAGSSAGADESSELEETFIKGFRAADMGEAETLDESSDPELAAEVESLRARIGAEEREESSPIDDVSSEDATLPIPTRDPERLFWVKRPGKPAEGPHPYPRVRETLAEAGAEGDPVAVSVDQRHWMQLAEFSRLSGQDLAIELSALPSSVTIVGSLKQRSMPAVFGLVARDQHTGTLSVANTSTEQWYEIQIADGRPVGVVTNVASMQLPSLLVGEDRMTTAQVEKLLNRIVATGRSWEEIGAAEGLPVLDRSTFMRERLIELFRWTEAEYAFNLCRVPDDAEPFAGSLLELLPRVVASARSADEIEKLLGPRMNRGLEPSWRFADSLADLRLSLDEQQAAQRLASGKTLQALVEETPEKRKSLLSLAYALVEADLLLEAFDKD